MFWSSNSDLIFVYSRTWLKSQFISPCWFAAVSDAAPENADPTDVTAAVTALMAVAVNDLWEGPGEAGLSDVLLGSCWSLQRRRGG